MPVCESPMGNVGGDSLSTAEVFSTLILIFLVIQNVNSFLRCEFLSRHGDWKKGAETKREKFLLCRPEEWVVLKHDRKGRALCTNQAFHAALTSVSRPTGWTPLTKENFLRNTDNCFRVDKPCYLYGVWPKTNSLNGIFAASVVSQLALARSDVHPPMRASVSEPVLFIL